MSGTEKAEAQTLSSSFAPGTVIGDKFRVDHVIGEGGMGIVVAATHLQLGERVALKFLRREAMSNEDVVARFAQEARAAVRLKSQYVARVLDVGNHDGVPFMVMEFLEGRDLGNVLAANGPLSIEDAAEFVVQACEGLAEAHARGIVHRDVKPENIFLTEHDGWRAIKLLDFGISKAALSGVGSEISTVKTSAIMGSPCYMSPEQLRSTKNVDHRADIWSVGAVLFELLGGVTPYDANVSLTQLVAMVLEQPPAQLRALRPDVPVELEQAVLKCLEKDPANRYQTVAQLAIALLPYAPRRARLAAERAISLTRAAGLSDTDLKIPASMFPSAPVGSTSGRPSGVRVAAPLLPNEYRNSTPNHETSAALSSATSVVTPAAPATRARWPWIAAPVALAVLCVVVWFLRPHPVAPPESQASAPSAVVAPLVQSAAPAQPSPATTQAAAAESAAEPAAVDPTTAEKGPRDAPVREATHDAHAATPRATARPARSAAPRASASSAPAGDLDIRLTR